MLHLPARLSKSVVASTLLFTVGVLALSSSSSRPAQAAAAFIPWSQIEGHPAPVKRNLPAGFYIFRSGQELTVASHGIPRVGALFSGRIFVENGVLERPIPIQHEKRGQVLPDTFVQQTPNVLDFRYITAGKLDGIKVLVKGGTRVGLDLRLQGWPSARTFFGQKPVPVVGSPLVIRLDQ